MKKSVAALLLAAVAVGASLTAAAPASAVLPTCYRQAPLDTGHIGPIDVPSAGTTAASTSCLMRQGDRGAAVLRLQQNLNICYRLPELEEDGIFGPLTRDALKRAQRAEGTAADGVYGPKTRDSLVWWAGGAGCWSVDGPGGN